MFSVVREPCANNSFLASFTPLAGHVLLYMTTMNLSIFSMVSELTSTGCRDRSRKAYVTDGQELHTLTMLTFFHATEVAARHSVALTGSMEEHQCFFVEIFHNLVDSNLSKVNTDSKANPELIKPKRQEMSYCMDNHIYVYGSDYYFAKSLSCTMRNVEQYARICLLMGTWLDIFDVAHVILCGDDRFILCADDHLSASFASLCAIGQIAKQFIFVSITPQESLQLRRNWRSCNHVLYLRSATVRYTIPCRLFQAAC